MVSLTREIKIGSRSLKKALISDAGANLDEETHVHRNFIANPAIGPNAAKQDGPDTDHDARH
jgi:hypothetical protein